MAKKPDFFEGWSWFKVNKLGVVLGMALRFCSSVAKGLKLKVSYKQVVKAMENSLNTLLQIRISGFSLDTFHTELKKIFKSLAQHQGKLTQVK